MTFKHLNFDISDTIGLLTFNRPKALNALNHELVQEMDAVLDLIEQDPGVRALVLTGAGDKAFVAGADISEITKLDSLGAKKFSTLGHKTFARLAALPIPVIAAVNGFALGGGTEVALACDFIYASEKAVFGLPEITLGIIPGFGGTQRLARVVGPNRAKELIYTGRTFPASDALTYGLVNQVCAPEALMETVMKTAKAMALKGRVCIQAAKESINSGLSTDLETGLKIEANAFALCLASPDAKEGTQAFLEKRKAKFL
ncbi:CrtA2 [Desulforapulum autotrophicum HRM2]|uniref:CrtA2 n=1 Tax=Desulforapulum autotrophicum (strain ATCC 43914 / DSM 3382 / VKM B-1955 / HRM2) TaxID=177437 RepID=C0QFR9_DESAH|nr:enoyl-CoA hydratase-related protein [Desulforapulum autotrophicum]ACN15487.1 CrtA2 [Desulforapulum autotrophicum HRM2]